MEGKEIQRKKLQDALDAQKTQKDRNVMGQFSTPYPLALDIMKYMRSLLGSEDVSFIEPSIGMGVFRLDLNTGEVRNFRAQNMCTDVSCLRVLERYEAGNALLRLPCPKA